MPVSPSLVSLIDSLGGSVSLRKVPKIICAKDSYREDTKDANTFKFLYDFGPFNLPKDSSHRSARDLFL